MTEGFFGEECPHCLSWTGEGVRACRACGHPVPFGFVLPYDDPPWEYSDELVETLRRYEHLRLMARYKGRCPERLSKLRHCRRLYLSRYQGFRFEFMSQFRALECFELDAASITDLNGVEALNASILKFTDCRALRRLDALADCKQVAFLSLALCNAVTDHSPIGAMKGLRSLFIEANAIESIYVLKGLSNLRSITLGVGKIVSKDLEPLFALRDLDHLAIRKKLVAPKDLARMRESWPGAEIVCD